MGATQQFSLLCLLQASIMTSSRNSGTKEKPREVTHSLQRGAHLDGPIPGSPMRATGTAAWRMCTVLSTAAWTLGKAQVAATVASGAGCRRSVAAVMRPSVPSEPTNSPVRL